MISHPTLLSKAHDNTNTKTRQIANVLLKIPSDSLGISWWHGRPLGHIMTSHRTLPFNVQWKSTLEQTGAFVLLLGDIQQPAN